MADNKYKILLRRGNESDLNTAFYDIGEPIFLSDSGKLLIKKNDGTMAEFVVSDDAKENTSNKVQEINFPSSDYYPSTKAVFDYVNSKLETPLSDIESLKSGKLDKTEFNSYKTDTDKAVGDNADSVKLLDTNKADLVQSHNMIDWSKLLSAHNSAFTVDKNEDEGYRITGTTTSKYNNVFPIQTLSLEDGDYYICDNATNNANASVYCQLNLIDTDGNRSYHSNKKVTIDNSKYTSINLSVQTGATVGEVDTVIYPMLCKYDDANIQYLPHRVAKGVTLLAKHMPEMKKDISDKANNIICVTDKSTSSVVTDSSQNYLKALTLYGNSVQSAVPTPTVPVEIESIKNPNVTLYRKNLFDTSKNVVSMNSKAQLVEWDRQNCSLTYTTNADYINCGPYFRHTTFVGVATGYGVDYTKLNGKSVTLSFDIQSDVNCKIGVQFTKYSYTYVDISSTKQRFSVTEVVDTSKLNKALCFYLNNVEATVTISNIQIEVGSIATDYESCECNSLTIEKSLHGIGDVCDTLTINEDGTGYITQNMVYERLLPGISKSGQPWNYSTVSKRFYRDDNRFKTNYGEPNLMCSHFKAADNERDTSLDETIGFTSGATTAHGIAIRKLDLNDDITAFEDWLDSNEVYILVPLVNPIITELSKEQVDKILSLYTYYPNTTIIADCDYQVEYVADTKSYIDNKILEVATALVAHESEVN